ncbi:FecR family protein [Pseudomonas aeruginosa]|uniref:FecR family protein n=1 Tax=Pseudomonas aeruginosa TaxID=287 RepID=UPI0010522144|nr:DUF4880 domain-containing protein [Pseudomonas aeruginosa]
MTASDSAADETGDLRHEAHAWVISLTSGRVTQGDARAFRQWCARSPQHLRAFVEARDLWQALGSAAALPLEPPAVAQIAPRRFGRRWFVGGALAASVALFVLRPSLLDHGLGCLEGSVRLEHLGQRLDLQAGQQLTFDERRNGPPVPFDVAEVMAWRERMLVFNDVPLATVIDEINRYRPGMLLLLDKALGRRRVQARFSLDQLADVATLIRDAYGIEVTRLPGGVVLLG